MNNPILVVLPYCTKDADLARELLLWIEQLTKKPHAGIMLAADSQVPRDQVLEMRSIAKRIFDFTVTILVPVSAGGWPANKMFMSVANQINEQYRWPWFWMEPDLTPLDPTWLDKLQKEYSKSPRRFLGAIVKQDKDPKLPKEHLAGCAVYPPDAYELFSMIPSVKDGSAAWDIAGAPVVVPAATHTDLLFHYWGKPDLAPTFVVKKEVGKDYPVNCFDLDRIPESAAMQHRCKDKSLILALKERMSAKSTK